MRLLSERLDHRELGDRLRDAHTVTTDLMSDVVDGACRRFPSNGRTEKTTRIKRLIGSEAWMDAALALIDLELPQWRVRRIAYDEGEWYCALSRARDLPEWLDSSIEAHHADLPLAILSAFIDARCISLPPSRPSVPLVPRDVDPICMPLCCENFA